MPATKTRSRRLDARKAIERAQSDPVGWAEHWLEAHLWSKQRSIVESVRDNRRTAVRSCRGAGKTYTAGITALWFLYCFPDARVITTATTWSQVRDLLWHEIGRLHRPVLGGTCLQTRLDLPDGRYAVGLSTKPEHQESFQGHHSENLLLIGDEASGIPQPIFDAGEGYLTTPGARLLLIGNPTRPSGEFHSAFHAKRGIYKTIHISAFHTPNFTDEEIPDEAQRRLISKEWVEEREGWKGTALWDVQVEGNFPRTTDDTVVALGEIEEAKDRSRKIAPDADCLVACDVARFGSDETVIVTRHGNVVRIYKAYVGRDTMQTAGAVIEAAKSLPRKPRIVIDDPGVGGGVTDRLREQGWEVTAFNGGEKALRPDDYPNARSELWFTFAEQHLPELDLDGDEQLIADLTAPRYKLDSSGRRVVEPKEDTKKRIGRSPDRGDAVLLTCAPKRGGVAEIW